MTAHLSPEDRDELRRLLSEANSGAMGMALRVARVEAIVADRLADAWDEAHNECCPRGIYCSGHPNPYRNP